MKLKFYLRGLGVGILFSVLIFSFVVIPKIEDSYTAKIEELEAELDSQNTIDISAIKATGTPSPTPTPALWEDVLGAMVKIPAREDFRFISSVTNDDTGEEVSIEKDYYLSAYNVTNAQYLEFVTKTGHSVPSYWTDGVYPQGKADHPVVGISYSDAVAYCEWLSSKYSGWEFRLPTEAEWENAARGEYYDLGLSQAKYPDGTVQALYDSETNTLQSGFHYSGTVAVTLLKQYGADYVVNYITGEHTGNSETLGECISLGRNGTVSNWSSHGGNSKKGYFLQTDLYQLISRDGGFTAPVGSYTANSYGLYDMAGNCWDLTSSIVVAQNGAERGASCYAVRGGSWYATARSCTFYYRGEGRRDNPSDTVGFRIAADRVEE